MSQITKEDIKKIARLARIEVPEADRENLAQQLTTITSWVGNLNEVNTDNVEAISSVFNSSLVMAKDEISDGNISQDVLANAKDAKYDYFAVPKVIE